MKKQYPIMKESTTTKCDDEPQAQQGDDKSTTTGSTNTSTNTSNTLSTIDFIVGFIIFHILFGIAIIISLLMFIGPFYFTNGIYIGLFITIPYYFYITTISTPELYDGYRIPNFSYNFILFYYLRNYFQLQIISNYNFFTCTNENTVINTNNRNNNVAQENVTSKTFNSNDKQQQQQQQQPDEGNDKQYIFAVYPHGVYSEYRILLDGILQEIIPKHIANNTKSLAANAVFRIPFLREIALYTGCVNATRTIAIKQLVQYKSSILVLPGGQAEQIRTIYKEEQIYINNRKGFIKLSLQYNIPIVPIYVFGVNDYYTTYYSVLLSLRLSLLKYTGMCIPIAFGQYYSPICPYPIKTTIVFDTPLQLPTPANYIPTNEEVDTAHSLYCTAITNLFNQHKHSLGYGDRTLQII